MKVQLLFTLIFALTVFQTKAQRVTPDKIETKKGVLTIQPVQHASLVLTWDKKTIYVDPSGGAAAFSGLAAPDLILITDIHGDHFDTKTLDSIQASKATLVVPQAVADKLPEALKAKAVILNNGKRTQQLGIGIIAIPMYNLPEAADSRHPKGRGNGYILTIGGKNIYISGDTEDIPEMRALKGIDVAFVCMNLPYTMDVNQAAQGVLAFKPKIVYAYHYRGQDGLSDVEVFKKAVNEGDPKIDVRLKDWYAKTK